MCKARKEPNGFIIIAHLYQLRRTFHSIVTKKARLGKIYYATETFEGRKKKQQQKGFFFASRKNKTFVTVLRKFKVGNLK
jgi:hypothetical protein